MSEETRNTYKDRKSKEKIAWITGSCAIIAAIISTISISFSFNVNTENEKLKKEYEDVVSENTDLSNQTNESQVAYDNLNTQYESLVSQNNDLQARVSSFENELSQYASIVEENDSLKKEINSVKAENTSLKKEIEELKNMIGSGTPSPTPTSTPIIGNKTSIFGMTTFRGNDHWRGRSSLSDLYFTDTYDNEYANAHLGYHQPCDESDLDSEPTYLLDKKYSKCVGHIAWSKAYKNNSGSAWIDFYSEKGYIISSETITADSRLTEFVCDVSGVEKLTVMTNGTDGVYVIYVDFDFIE